MVLNYIWIAFFLIAFVVALCKLVIGGDTEVFTHIINASFASAKTGFEISLGLTGVLALWLGIMKIGEKGGVIQAFARLTAPVFSKLFPGIPKDHPATGSIFMCLSANLLGLDNAATPMGLKAMKELQELNAKKESASDPMIMFLCINASGLTLIPVSIMTYRAQMGAANPAPYARNLLFHPGGHIGGLFQATNQHFTTESIAFLRRHDHVRRWPGLAFRDDEPAIGLPLLYPVCQHFTFLHHMRIHHQRYSQENQRIRHFYRRSERRFPDRRNDHPLPHRRPGRHCRFPGFRSNGFPDRRHSHGSRGSRTGHAICGRPAYHADEAA